MRQNKTAYGQRMGDKCFHGRMVRLGAFFAGIYRHLSPVQRVIMKLKCDAVEDQLVLRRMERMGRLSADIIVRYRRLNRERFAETGKLLAHTRRSR